MFVSYARPDEGQAERVAGALRDAGYQVWRDDELPAHRAYADVIEERLRSARAVIVLWSAEAVKSQWVRSEANVARSAGTLVQATIDGSMPPLPFDQIQCADLSGWRGGRKCRGLAKAYRKRRGARRARRRKEDRTAKSIAAPARRLRIALCEHERRHRTGIFQRRDQ